MEQITLQANSLKELNELISHQLQEGWCPIGKISQIEGVYYLIMLKGIKSSEAKYKILESSSKTILEEMVNKAIREGWEPVGGIAVSDQSSPAVMNKDILVPRFVYLQAVVKKEY